jgi:hypothetical protein
MEFDVLKDSSGYSVDEVIMPALQIVAPKRNQLHLDAREKGGRLNILVVSDRVKLLQNIACVFSPEFIFSHRAKITISSSLVSAIDKIENSFFNIILMEGDELFKEGRLLKAFVCSPDSRCNGSAVITVDSDIDLMSSISLAIQ